MGERCKKCEQMSSTTMELPDRFFCNLIPNLDCSVPEESYDAQQESITQSNYELPDLTEGTEIDCYFSHHSTWQKATILEVHGEEKIRVKYHIPGSAPTNQLTNADIFVQGIRGVG